MTDRSKLRSGFGKLAAAAVLSFAILSPGWISTPVLAQTLKDSHCTGKSDIPDDQQITGCSDAIACADRGKSA